MIKRSRLITSEISCKQKMESDEAKRLKSLINERDNIESEIKELMEVLDSQKGVGLHEPLTDKEDFPRADIDIYSVRHARQRVICLQGDHKRVMKAIEEGLHAVHEKARERTGSGEVAMDTGNSDKEVSENEAFVRVDRVDMGSPASEAGLQIGDLVTAFGSVNISNFSGLSTIGQVVQHSKDRAVSVSVIREGKSQRLTLTPKTWSGRGLLGCNIVPVKS